MKRLDGKIAVITGGGNGIGRAIAIGFAREGASLVLLDKDFPALEEARRAVESHGAPSLSCEVDVTNEQSVADAIQQATDEFHRIDILINNAGQVNASDVASMTLAKWQEILAVDLTGVFLCSRAVLPSMMESRSGRIINIGSQLAFCGAANFAHYASAKAGVHAFTKSLALEVASYGITVNAIAPGPIETNMLRDADPHALANLRDQIPLGRFGHPEEVVPTTLLLASSDGAFYTGAILNMSGGHVML